MHEHLPVDGRGSSRSTSPRPIPEHALVALQRSAGNQAVAAMVGRRTDELQREADNVQRDPDPGAVFGPPAPPTAPASGGGAVAGRSGTVVAPPKTEKAPAGDNGVAPEAQLSADSSTVTLNIVAHKFNAASPDPLDLLHEPGISIQVTPGNTPKPVVQAAVAALNAHIQAHHKDLIELSLNPQAQVGPGGVAGGVQAQAEIHLTTTFSITASSTLGVAPHGGSPDPSQVPVASGRTVDLNWQPISVGTLFHLSGPEPKGDPGAPLNYAALQSEGEAIRWVAGQLSRSDFTSPKNDALEIGMIVTTMYDAMHSARGDTADVALHGMPPLAQLPDGLSNGLRRAAQLLAQNDPALAALRLVRVNVFTAAGSGESLIRTIPLGLEPSATFVPSPTAAPAPAP